MPYTATTPQEATLDPSFPKVLGLTAISTGGFVIGGCILVGMQDPIFIPFICMLGVGITPVFAAFTYLMLRCRIGHDGLRPAVPSLRDPLIRWSDVTTIRKSIGSPFYVVRGRGLTEFAVLPSEFLLKDPKSLARLIEQYAPADKIVREKFVG